MRIKKNGLAHIQEKLGTDFTCPLCHSEFEFTSEKDFEVYVYIFEEEDVYRNKILRVAVNCPVCLNTTDHLAVFDNTVEVL